MSAEELLDVINEKDEVIGVATKQECHSNPDLMHHTVQFTLIDPEAEKILLTQRSFKKSHDAGLYCFLGEHILSGETYEEAVLRGVEEELGFKPSKFVYCNKNIFKYQTQTELVKFYLVYWNNQDLAWDKNEMESVLWVSLKDLLSKKYKKSSMTTYWINHINWASFLGVKNL